MLTSPFNFDELCGRFANSWRVSDNSSLLSPTGTAGIESRSQERIFFAENLVADVRAKASAVYRAARVIAGPLLDACTLDVAVIGQDAAAKVFVKAPAPVAVGTVNGGGSTVPSLLKAWWWRLQR